MPNLEVKIPPMGESIISGVLAKWHVNNGDVVQKDQPLFELETDKITSEGTAEAAGRITLSVEAGAEVKIGQVVATIDTAAAGAATPSSRPAPGATATGQDGTPTSALPNPYAPPGTAQAASAIAKSPGAGAGQPTPAPKSLGTESPAVRRLAAETGVDPAKVSGTGKAGRVTKGDMLAAAESKSAAPTIVAGVADPGPGSPSPATTASSRAQRQTRRKMSPLRQKIAQRLVAAQQEAAMLTTFNEVDMSHVMVLRAKYQDDFVKRHGIKLGFMSFFLKAAVHALREVPAVNAQIDGDSIVENHFYDIGVAVSTDRGLMVPVIRDCDTIGMADMEKQIATAATKARDGKITLADLEGGVFTITNGGIFGSMLSTPIINPPQSAILGMHAINERPVAVNGQVVIRPMMYLALSYDHRLVDGKQAVTFLVRVKQAIEDPTRLVLGI
ncbi:2-oxoglutarate dehydrogenase complex dihydrolipoyllysine-residue succinyltransferase [Opitutus terrae]|uniref:Dihydrolipoyllysine-residue succinyltransferase component of 2-oxoglutarate dehydrogenase complex n=1 Tax=Opitutus terrae (strain DSM 11246 / JCM 15787 / PB90-1) TaxID=452637 RepID=B1ZNX5_OPITP|nr:2-oxoglutarate dehydrogenase complex dihydrolipoyllysine-residue succinyltransferase [Opitutus terrae]ACB77464.1 2-oxoglutarate dehydrogenase, E2 subunit, dihydrolipoamide succinyltransferase [Opitutus terrae PB90-1]